MKTTQPLTPGDIKILNAYRDADAADALSLIFIGLFLAIISAIVLYNMSVAERVFPALVSSAFVIGGIGLIVHSINRLFTSQGSTPNLPYGNTKQVITGQLTKVEVTDGKHLRYHFGNDSIELYVPAGLASIGNSFDGQRTIENVSVLAYQTVTLSFVIYKPGVNVLLNIRYDQLTHTESVAPLDKEDRKILAGNYSAIMIALITICVLITFTINCIGRFETDIILFTLLVPVAPVALICFLLQYRLKERRKKQVNKIMVRTVITETMTVKEKGHKSHVSWHIYSRLSDGSIVNLGRSAVKLGDTIELRFLQLEDGSRGTVI